MFYDGDKPLDGRNIKLNVLPGLEDTTGDDSTGDDDQSGDDSTGDDDTTTGDQIQPPTVLEDTSKEFSFEGQTWYIVTLIVLIVIIIVLIIFLLAKFMK